MLQKKHMEKEKAFIVKLPEEPKTPRQYESSEIRSDFSLFSEEAKSIIQKYLETGGESMTPQEYELFNDARNTWWQEKYGFPYGNKIAREEVLRRKYAPSKELVMQQELQNNFFQAYKENDTKEIQRINKVYEEQYPNQLEGVAVIFGLIPYLKNQHDLYENKFQQNEKTGEIVEEITQYQFLVTDFIKHNSNQKEFLTIFWEALETVAKDSGFLSGVHGLRRAVLSQVATLKIFETLGKHPTLSHPKEDAFRAIDIWTDKETVVQIKGAYDLSTSIIVKTDVISFPAIEVKDKNGQNMDFFASKLSSSFQKFKIKVSKYQKIVKKKLRGYLVVVPYEKFDFVTGEPDEEIIQQVKQALETKE